MNFRKQYLTPILTLTLAFILGVSAISLAGQIFNQHITLGGPTDPIEAWSEFGSIIWKYNSTLYMAQNMSTNLVSQRNTNLTRLEVLTMGNMSAGGTIWCKEVQWNTTITLSNSVLVVESYLGSMRTYTNQGRWYLTQLASDPSTVGWGLQERGRWWYNTADNRIKYWDGTQIQILPGYSSGSEGISAYSAIIYKVSSTYYWQAANSSIMYSGTDASKVFNFAIANTSVKGGVVFAKVASYVITNPIIMRSNVDLLGEMRGSTTSKGSILNIQLDVSNYAVQFNVTAIGASLSRSSIKNFGILSDTGHTDKGLISVVSAVASGWRTSYTDIVGNDLIERTTDSPAIYLDQTDGNNLLIDNNYIAGGTSTGTTRNSNGIYIKSLDHGTITRNQIMYCKTYGIGKTETVSGTQLYYSEISNNHIGYGFNQTASAINLNTTGSLIGVNIDNNWFELTDPAGNHFLDDWTVPVFAVQSGTSGLKGDVNIGSFNVIEYFGKTARITNMSQWVKIGVGFGSVPNYMQVYELTGAYYGGHWASIGISANWKGEVRRLQTSGNATVAAGTNSISVHTNLDVDLGSISVISTNSTFTGTYYITKADDTFVLTTSTTGSGVWMYWATS